MVSISDWVDSKTYKPSFIQTSWLSKLNLSLPSGLDKQGSTVHKSVVAFGYFLIRKTVPTNRAGIHERA